MEGQRNRLLRFCGRQDGERLVSCSTCPAKPAVCDLDRRLESRSHCEGVGHRSHRAARFAAIGILQNSRIAGRISLSTFRTHRSGNCRIAVGPDPDRRLLPPLRRRSPISDLLLSGSPPNVSRLVMPVVLDCSRPRRRTLQPVICGEFGLPEGVPWHTSTCSIKLSVRAFV
jgi:hypothetical protein